MTTGDEWRNERTRAMFEAILSLETIDEAASFFRDLCTLGELDAMSQRWQVVLLLDEGLSYRDIAERTGASTATVTRISQWFHHGAGGYRLVADRLGAVG